jgi:hypothetical protein
MLLNNGESSSKAFQSRLKIDSLPSSASRDPSCSPSTELQLATRHQNPLAPPLHSLPKPSVLSPTAPEQPHSSASIMAYQQADPSSFTLNGFQAIEVQHREMMARVVLRHSQATHEDFAIVTIHPIPDNVLQFDAVHEVVQEFLEEHMDIRVRDIQPSHLGQALVQFNRARDRDLLINLSP